MILMALDHVRDYFHYSAFYFDPADPELSTLPIFFTRFITHFCAPIFCFLAGTSAYFVGKRKTKTQLSLFLVKRGLWLIFIEMTIVNFAWYFDIYFRSPGLSVIWALGASMLFMAILVHLPKKVLLGLGLLIILGHNLLDPFHFNGNIFWAILHEPAYFALTKDIEFAIDYPVLPWIGVMAIGFCFGSLYSQHFDSTKRRILLLQLAFSCLFLFFILRLGNFYGDTSHFTNYETLSRSLISFFNPSKYPPSLLYLLMTLGVAFLFLAFTEKVKGRLGDFLCTFGRVPFFYYILHLFLIHTMALIYAEFAGYGWELMILQDWVTQLPALDGYGLPLWLVYIVWLIVVFTLFPICNKFDLYKQKHKEKWWLSYL